MIVELSTYFRFSWTSSLPVSAQDVARKVVLSQQH